MMLWTALLPAGPDCPAEPEGGDHGWGDDDRPRHRQDGLFAKGKFCLIRRSRLVLPQRPGRSGTDGVLPAAGDAVPRGSRPLGVVHEATAVGAPPAAGRPVASRPSPSRSGPESASGGGPPASRSAIRRRNGGGTGLISCF